MAYAQCMASRGNDVPGWYEHHHNHGDDHDYDRGDHGDNHDYNDNGPDDRDNGPPPDDDNGN